MSPSKPKTRRPRKPKRPAWQPDDTAIEAIVAGKHGDPFAVLGLHGGDGDPLSVRAFWPGADGVEVIDRGDRRDGCRRSTRLHPGRLFRRPDRRPPRALRLSPALLATAATPGRPRTPIAFR